MWKSTVLGWIARYGYWGLGFGILAESAGLPVPGEAALVGASVGAAHGLLSLPVVIVVAVLASVTGDNLGFLLGRRLGRQWAVKHGRRFLLTPKRLARVDSFFDRFGPVAVALARFVVGVREIAAFAAGASRMRWRVFLVYNIIGALAWASLVSVVGYGAGVGYARMTVSRTHAVEAVAVALGVILLAIWFVMRRSRGHTATQSGNSDTTDAAVPADNPE